MKEPWYFLFISRFNFCFYRIILYLCIWIVKSFERRSPRLILTEHPFKAGALFVKRQADDVLSEGRSRLASIFKKN